jgi:hypothetical protein
MTKGEIIDGVVELVQDASAAMRGNIGRWVNLVLGDVASRGYLKSLQREERAVLTAGNGIDMVVGRNYDLNTDTDKVFKVFIPALGCDAVLRCLNEDQFMQKMVYEGFTATGMPQFYTIFGLKTLRVHPIPSLTYAPLVPTDLQKLYVWKYKDPAQLTETNTITEWKLKHNHIILAGAYAYGARFDSLNDYVTTKAEYERGIDRLFSDQNTDLDRAKQVAYNDS